MYFLESAPASLRYILQLFDPWTRPQALKMLYLQLSDVLPMCLCSVPLMLGERKLTLAEILLFATLFFTLHFHMDACHRAFKNLKPLLSNASGTRDQHAKCMLTACMMSLSQVV